MNYRQGDVYLFACELPKNLEKHHQPVLAYGEVTGHHHVILDGEVLVDSKGQLYVQAGEETSISHQDERGLKADHDAIAISPGSYRVVIQNEYQPEGWRKVID